MKNIKLILVFTCLFLVGCESASNSRKIQSRKDKIELVNQEFSQNSDEKLETIATYSSGIEYSLSQIEKPATEITTTIELNKRISSLAGNPNIDEFEKVKQLVDLLNSEIKKDREHGLAELKRRDNKILELQLKRVEIQNEYNAQIELLKKESAIVAAKADKYEATIDEVNSYMGFGAIIYGIKKFLSQGLTIIVIASIIFIVLKLAAQTNPIAASVFYIFETIGGYIIAAIKGLLPNSTTSVNLVDAKYKQTLNKIVSIFEGFKLSKSRSNYTLDDILETFSKQLDPNDKNTIDESKKEIKNKL